MAFDVKGFRQAAKQAGIPSNQIDQAIAERTGATGWLTGGKQGFGAVASGVGNVLNLPSYAVGGVLNRGQRALGSKYAQGTDPIGTGVWDGIKNKRAVMSELPESFNIDPNSAIGMGVGFAGELLTPNIPFGKISDLADLGKSGVFSDLIGIGKTEDALMAGRNKLAGSLASESENILTRGMGNPQSLKKVRGVSPVPMDKLFEKYNLYDRSAETFSDAAKTANLTGKKILLDSPASISTKRILDLFDEEISRLAPKANSSTKMRSALDELVQRKQMFLDSIQNENMSTPLINDASRVYDIKSNFQGDIPASTFGQPTQEVGKNLGVTKAYKTLLSGVEEQAPGIKNVGREQSALIRLSDIARNSDARGAARQNINFSKMGSAGLGGIMAGIPGAVAGFAGEQVANSPRFLSASSRAMGKAADVIGGDIPKISFPKINNPYLKTGLNVTGKALDRTPMTAARLQAVPNASVRTEQKGKQTKSSKVSPYSNSIASNSKKKDVFSNKAGFGRNFRLKPLGY